MSGLAASSVAFLAPLMASRAAMAASRSRADRAPWAIPTPSGLRRGNRAATEGWGVGAASAGGAWAEPRPVRVEESEPGGHGGVGAGGDQGSDRRVQVTGGQGALGDTD